MIFADPYKKCLECGQWIDGAEDEPGPLLLIPCGHRSDFKDVCPSWGPVDGCTCVEANARCLTDPIVHEQRVPQPDDRRVYGGPAPVPFYG